MKLIRRRNTTQPIITRWVQLDMFEAAPDNRAYSLEENEPDTSRGDKQSFYTFWITVFATLLCVGISLSISFLF